VLLLLLFHNCSSLKSECLTHLTSYFNKNDLFLFLLVTVSHIYGQKNRGNSPDYTPVARVSGACDKHLVRRPIPQCHCL